MKQSDIDSIVAGGEVILLDTHQFINVKHSQLKSVLSLVWRHDTHKLLIQKVNNSDHLQNNPPIDLNSIKFLVLNHLHQGHERVYAINIDSHQRLILIDLHPKPHYSLKVEIIDEQI